MHHTKDKGDLGVLKAQVDLHEQGFMLLTPVTEHACFDLVAYRSGQFKRIQVKFREARNGQVSISFATSWADKNGSHYREYNKSEVDYFCIYCPQTDQCYYVDPNQFGKSVTLRVEASKNNQTTNINWANDYRRVP